MLFIGDEIHEGFHFIVDGIENEEIANLYEGTGVGNSPGRGMRFALLAATNVVSRDILSKAYEIWSVKLEECQAWEQNFGPVPNGCFMSALSHFPVVIPLIIGGFLFLETTPRIVGELFKISNINNNPNTIHIGILILGILSMLIETMQR